MQEFDVISGLLSDACGEMAYIKKYTTEQAKAKEKNDYREVWKMRAPSKQRVKDDLRVIRRLTLEIERALDEQ